MTSGNGTPNIEPYRALYIVPSSSALTELDQLAPMHTYLYCVFLPGASNTMRGNSSGDEFTTGKEEHDSGIASF